MSRPKRPDKDMEQPKAYKSSIDPSKPQPSMKIDTRQTHYKPAKPIDFNNKIPEYKPKNQYYKASFWDVPKKQLVQKPKEKPKESPRPQPQPRPKLLPPRRAPPTPKRQTMQPLPQANFNKPKKAPIPPAQPPPEPHPLPRTPPPQEPDFPQYPVRHFEPQEEPEAVWSPSPPAHQGGMEQWGEPAKVIPDLNPRPPPVEREHDFSSLPSTVGSMSRMMAMFT